MGKEGKDQATEFEAKAEAFKKLAGALTMAQTAADGLKEAKQLVETTRQASVGLRKKADDTKAPADVSAADAADADAKAAVEALEKAREEAEALRAAADQMMAEDEGLATLGQKIGLAIVLIVATVLVVWAWFETRNSVEERLHHASETEWVLPPTHGLQVAGAFSFSFDSENNVLKCRGPVSAEMKEELAALLYRVGDSKEVSEAKANAERQREASEKAKNVLDERAEAATRQATASQEARDELEAAEAAVEEGQADGKERLAEAEESSSAAEERVREAQRDLERAQLGALSAEKATAEARELVEELSARDQTTDPVRKSYLLAVSTLAFEANEDRGYAALLLLLGGISGIMGVQLRSLVNFVGVTCWKNILSVRRWWPWYYLRPVQGFLLGMLAVVLIESNILDTGELKGSGTNWWFAVAMIAGFGASEFYDRLRLLTQTLFGKSGN